MGRGRVLCWLSPGSHTPAMHLAVKLPDCVYQKMREALTLASFAFSVLFFPPLSNFLCLWSSFFLLPSPSYSLWSSSSVLSYFTLSLWFFYSILPIFPFSTIFLYISFFKIFSPFVYYIMFFLGSSTPIISYLLWAVPPSPPFSVLLFL